MMTTTFPNKYSFNFDGSNNYLELENNSALSFGTNAHTISAWAKLDVLANYKTIISKRQAGGTATDWGYGTHTDTNQTNSSSKWVTDTFSSLLTTLTLEL